MKGWGSFTSNWLQHLTRGHPSRLNVVGAKTRDKARRDHPGGVSEGQRGWEADSLQCPANPWNCCSSERSALGSFSPAFLVFLDPAAPSVKKRRHLKSLLDQMSRQNISLTNQKTGH